MKWKELIKHIECSEVLVECEWLVAVSRKGWKVQCPRVPWPRYHRKLPFWNSRPCMPIFMLARSLDSRPQSRVCQWK